MCKIIAPLWTCFGKKRITSKHSGALSYCQSRITGLWQGTPNLTDSVVLLREVEELGGLPGQVVVAVE